MKYSLGISNFLEVISSLSHSIVFLYFFALITEAQFGLQLNIQKTKIMASGPITSWQIDGETVETVADFILGGSKITADGDCSGELKRHYSLEGKL